MTHLDPSAETFVNFGHFTQWAFVDKNAFPLQIFGMHERPSALGTYPLGHYSHVPSGLRNDNAQHFSAAQKYFMLFW